MAVTEVTFVVDPDAGTGYDYDSLTDWEAGEVTNSFIAEDKRYTAKCRSTGGSADVQSVTISSTWVTDATHYLKIWTDPTDTGSGGGGKDYGSGATHRHDGKWNDNAYRLEVTNVRGITVIGATERHLHVHGLQIKTTQTTSWNKESLIHNSPGVLVCEGTIFRGVITGGLSGVRAIASGASSHTSYIINCLVYGYTNGTAYDNYVNGGAYYLYNCVAIDCYYGYRVEYTTTKKMRNCLAQGCTDGFRNYWANADGRMQYCASDIAGDALGTGAVEYTCEFVDDANDDFHLTATDTEELPGTDLSGDSNYPFSVDIDNQTRTLWSIGADDGESAAGEEVTIVTAVLGYGKYIYTP